MNTADQMLEDFLVFLVKEGYIFTSHRPSGQFYFGKAIKTAEEIISNYWEGFQ